MNESEMLAAALSYAARGWRIIPCRPGQKIPLTEHGCKDATTDAATITAWWTRWPTANIALACGPGSGVYVIDVDLDIEKEVDGWGSLEEFPALPATVRQNSPRGGAHFLFRSDKPPRNKNCFRPGIDIRSEGYYIMLAPSVHPNGKVYEWAQGAGPDDITLAEFPDNVRPEPPKVALPWETKPVTTTPRAPTSPQATPIVERARLYLQECESAVQGQAGHEKLLWAARALVVGFEIDEGTAVSMLWSDFNPRCIPPWDRGSPADIKDFERKVAEARRTPGSKPRGWLLDELGLRGHDGELEAYGRKLAAGLLAGIEKKQPEPEHDPEARPEIINPKKARPTGMFPDWLLNPPGMVGQLVEWINATAGCSQPTLALGCALTACGALFGRKVRDQSNGRTNLYMMGVAHSSAGKDHPADCVETLFTRAGAAVLLGGSRVTSDSAIEVALTASPVQLFNWDECGHMLQAIKQAGTGSGGAQHLKTIVPALMQLYSSAHKLYIGKQRADEEVRRVDQPHVCVWGLTSPDVLYAGLSTAELRDGWLGRVVTVISHDRPKYMIKQHLPPPEHLVTLVQAWLTRAIPPPEGAGNIAGATGVYQLEIPTQPDAMAIFEAFRDECHETMLRCDSIGDDTQYLWGKGLQNARRISLIVATGDRFDGQEITAFHAKYGCEFVRCCIKQFTESIKNNLSDNAWEAEKQNILKILTKAGRTGVSKMELTKRTQSIRDRKVRDSYIADLIEAGLINFGPHPLHPEAKAGWLWKAPFGLSFLDKETK